MILSNKHCLKAVSAKIDSSLSYNLFCFELFWFELLCYNNVFYVRNIFYRKSVYCLTYFVSGKNPNNKLFKNKCCKQNVIQCEITRICSVYKMRDLLRIYKSLLKLNILNKIRHINSIYLIHDKYIYIYVYLLQYLYLLITRESVFCN